MADVTDPRMAGLQPAQVEHLHAAARAIRDNRPDEARRRIDSVLAAVPGHAEALRLSGLLHGRRGERDRARDVLAEAAALHPDDALLACDLGSAQAACGDADAAQASWRRACALAPEQPMPWFNLGRSLQQRGDSEDAIAILQRAASLAPAMWPARILLADALVHLGRLDEAAQHYRGVLGQHPACGDAWRGLSSIRTRALTDADAAQLHALLQRRDIAETDRIAMAYTLGRLEEDRGRHAEAFAALSTANAAMRARAPWSAKALRDYVDAALAATATLPAPLEPALGHEVIFIVGLPRSGSTLFEQILAAHPDVEGASELPDLGLVVQEESMRRGMPYPQWVPQATAADWLRLGRDYLARTARWRVRRPRFTDKMPENWKHAGILRAMLPAATVLEVRRDPLETGWSCFRQQFFQLPHFSCDLADIGVYLRTCARAMDAWRARDPGHVLLRQYEDLVAGPEAGIRALLEACGLPFDAKCLDFHAAARSVRTASAAQVRQPIRPDTARAAGYGALLDPLRRALAAD